MRLTYLVPFWPYLYTPWLFREVAWMRSRGHDVSVASLGPPPGPEANLKDFGLADLPVLRVEQSFASDLRMLRDMGRLPVASVTRFVGKSLPQRRRDSGFRQGLHEWVTFKRLISFLEEHKTDVIEAHWASQAADMALEVKQATGIPYAIRLHGGDVYRSPSPHLARMVAGASAVCPVSRFIARLLQGERPVPELPQVPRVELPAEKLRVCHNAIPGEFIAKEPAPQNPARVLIGSTGRLDPEKRHADLLDAFAPLAPEFPGAGLKLIGGGRLEPELRAQAEKLGIADRLEITGPQPWDQVIRHVRELAVYVQSSAVEGCSLAVIEGAAQGLPLVLSLTGANAESIDEGVNGHIYPYGDVPALRDRLRRVLAATPDERRRMGARTLEIVRKEFQFESLMPRVEAILDAVRAGQPLPA